VAPRGRPAGAGSGFQPTTATATATVLTSSKVPAHHLLDRGVAEHGLGKDSWDFDAVSPDGSLESPADRGLCGGAGLQCTRPGSGTQPTPRPRPADERPRTFLDGPAPRPGKTAGFNADFWRETPPGRRAISRLGLDPDDKKTAIDRAIRSKHGVIASGRGSSTRKKGAPSRPRVMVSRACSDGWGAVGGTLLRRENRGVNRFRTHCECLAPDKRTPRAEA